MKPLHLALTLAILAVGPLAAAQDNPNPGGGDGNGGGGGAGATYSILFSTTGTGHDATVSGIGTLLSELTRQDIGVVTPAVGASAETFLDNANYNVVHGDKDFDAIWFDPNIGQAIDAITVCGDASYAKFPRCPDVFFSVKANIGIAGLTAVMTPGDVASPRLGGAYSYLITEAQIRMAFDIPANEIVDVDAVEKADDGTLYLSLENDVWIRGGAVLSLDGDMLMIAAADLVYNGCQVIAVTPGAGTIAVFEAQWDNMVMMSGVADAAGLPVMVVGDLNALAFDPTGAGTWNSPGLDGIVALPHVLFSGDFLDGAGVLSTQAAGSIAVLNGVALAAAAPMPTTGTQMGLLPGSAATVRPVGNLCVLDHDPLRVIADAAPLLPLPGDTLHVEVGGLDALGPCALMGQAGMAAAGGSAPGFSITNPGFGFAFALPPLFMIGGLAAGPLGHLVVTGAYAGGVPAGTTLLLQPITVKAGFGAIVFGGPVLMQF